MTLINNQVGKMESHLIERLRGVFPASEYHHAVIETQALKKEAANRVTELEAAVDGLTDTALKYQTVLNEADVLTQSQLMQLQCDTKRIAELEKLNANLNKQLSEANATLAAVRLTLGGKI